MVIVGVVLFFAVIGVWLFKVLDNADRTSYREDRSPYDGPQVWYGGECVGGCSGGNIGSRAQGFWSPQAQAERAYIEQRNLEFAHRLYPLYRAEQGFVRPEISGTEQCALPAGDEPIEVPWRVETETDYERNMDD